MSAKINAKIEVDQLRKRRFEAAYKEALQFTEVLLKRKLSEAEWSVMIKLFEAGEAAGRFGVTVEGPGL